MAKTARKLDDYGAIIEGARKDRWRDRAMTVEDLDTLSLEEAAKFVSKDLVWPVPDYSALAAAGHEPGALALMKIMRDRIPVMPTRMPTRDPAKANADYVRVVTAMREAAAAAKSFEEAKRLASTVMTAIGYRYADPESRAAATAVSIRGKVAFDIAGTEIRRAAKMAAAGFPEQAKVEAWRKGVTFRLVQGQLSAIKDNRIIAQGEGPDEVDALLKAAWEAERQRKSSGPKSPPMYRERMGEIVRSGLPDHRQGRHVSPREFVETFGFSGVQFGEWLSSDGERQAVLDHAFDALKDLAWTLEIPDTAIGFNGRLAVAFGARGNGMPAHYESTRTVFNISRLSGAGSVAHEWAHAFDHFCGDAGAPGKGTGEVRSGSGWRDWTRSRTHFLANLGEDAARAWDDLMRIMSVRTRTNEEEIESLGKTISSRKERLEGEVKRLEDYLEANGETGTFPRRMRKWLAEEKSSIAKIERLRLEYVADPKRQGRPMATSYMQEASKLCGESGDYWKRPNEMFARAFECAVFDRMAARGGRSDYLVEGVEATKYADPDAFKGNPYPTGEERKAISEAIWGVVFECADAMTPDSRPTPAA